MNIIDAILWPIKWVIEAILVGWHTLLTAVGLDPAAGLTWVLSIVGLVLVVRAALIPLTVKQITPRSSADYGEVRWDAVVTNADGDPVATYDVLTLVAKEWAG